MEGTIHAAHNLTGRVKESFSEMVTSKHKPKRQEEVSLVKEYGSKIFCQTVKIAIKKGLEAKESMAICAMKSINILSQNKILLKK